MFDCDIVKLSLSELFSMSYRGVELKFHTFQSRHYTQESGHLHVLAVLSPVNNPLVFFI